MSSQIQVKPAVNRLIKFMTEIEDGKFKIPTFQRDFVWEKKTKLSYLIASVRSILLDLFYYGSQIINLTIKEK